MEVPRRKSPPADNPWANKAPPDPAPQKDATAATTNSQLLEQPKRRRSKRPRIPIPSFAPIESYRSQPANKLRVTAENPSVFNIDNDDQICPANKLSPAVDAAATALHSSNNDDDQPRRNNAQVPPEKESDTLLRPPSSRIGGVLSYQRYRQHLDPSLPRHYTRKELQVMNDETPTREESPPFVPPTRKPQGTSRQALFETPDFATQPPSVSSEAQRVIPSPVKQSVSVTGTDGKQQPLSTFPVKRVIFSEPAKQCTHHNTPATAAVSAGKQTNAAANTVSNNTTKSDRPVGSTQNSKSPTQTSKQSTASPSKPPSPQIFRLYFVPRGRDMHEGVLVGPKRIARARGAIVLDSFDRHGDPDSLPTHLVIGTVSSPDVVSRALGFASSLELQHFMYEHQIQCATKAWATKIPKNPTEPYQNPRPSFVLQQLGVRHLEVYAPLVPRAPPTHKSGTHASAQRSPRAPPAQRQSKRNVALANILKQLSKAYQDAPIEHNDNWRAYTFENASSRVQALDFEIRSSESLQHVKSIKGFGKSTIEIIQEFVKWREDNEDDEADTVGDDEAREIPIQRLRKVRNDSQRRALRTMKKIWGVGPAKGLELVEAGYTSADQVKKDFEENQLVVKLQRNQYVGLLCYDDILEDMDRSEVEMIAAIVREAVCEYYSQAEVEIMGSYRRGSEFCGDVDILLTHPKFPHKVPPKALGKIIDSLRVKGHVAYNLTQLPGMDTDAWETLPRDIAKRFGQPIVLRPKADKDTCSSYMGIFNSPVFPNKKRRVDIKMYPYRERIFATLYFTGNGFFNRSMRLWAKRKFGYRLSDKGMFQLGTDVRVMDAMNEEQIFRRLELVYREPTERDGFDAVIGLDSKRAIDLEALSSKEFFEEESQHEYIK